MPEEVEDGEFKAVVAAMELQVQHDIVCPCSTEELSAFHLCEGGVILYPPRFTTIASPKHQECFQVVPIGVLCICKIVLRWRHFAHLHS